MRIKIITGNNIENISCTAFVVSGSYRGLLSARASHTRECESELEVPELVQSICDLTTRVSFENDGSDT
jgi:hypothetical protein